MNKSKYSNSELRNMGECLIKCGDAALGTALLELADYRSREQKIMARHRFDRAMLQYVNPDVLETEVKSGLSRKLADKMVEDRIVWFTQSFDNETNEIVFYGEVNVLKGD